MSTLLLLTVILSITLIPPSANSADSKPTKSITPLSADDIAIYKSVLQEFAFQEQIALNVAEA